VYRPTVHGEAMIGKLVLLHLRWFGLFAFVGGLAIVFGNIQEGQSAVFTTAAFWIGLAPVIAVVAILAVLVPWLVFMIDPRRPAGAVTAEAFLRYWKAL